MKTLLVLINCMNCFTIAFSAASVNCFESLALEMDQQVAALGLTICALSRQKHDPIDDRHDLFGEAIQPFLSTARGFHYHNEGVGSKRQLQCLAADLSIDLSEREGTEVLWDLFEPSPFLRARCLRLCTEWRSQ